jgi:RNA polymerase sigma-70 factor (ECF subfamily)
MVERLYPLVLKIARARLCQRASEEDLCQMVFIRVFRSLGQYSGRAPFEHWVARVAVNVCLNEIERERVRPELREADFDEEQARIVRHLAVSPAEIPEDDADTAHALVQKLLLRLSPEDRLIITMLHLEERSIAEIAALTGWNTVLIKVRAFRARQKMKRLCGSIVRPDL